MVNFLYYHSKKVGTYRRSAAAITSLALVNQGKGYSGPGLIIGTGKILNMNLKWFQKVQLR